MVDNFAFADLPDEVIGFKYPFPRLAAAFRKDPVRIVAMGSSSTAGREDVVPYPHWLEMYLRRDTGNARIDVLNRGKGGEEADKELARFDPDIFAEAPSLVIWQVGTRSFATKSSISRKSWLRLPPVSIGSAATRRIWT
jgi:hypothetical protein